MAICPSFLRPRFDVLFHSFFVLAPVRGLVLTFFFFGLSAPRAVGFSCWLYSLLGFFCFCPFFIVNVIFFQPPGAVSPGRCGCLFLGWGLFCTARWFYSVRVCRQVCPRHAFHSSHRARVVLSLPIPRSGNLSSFLFLFFRQDFRDRVQVCAFGFQAPSSTLSLWNFFLLFFFFCCRPGPCKVFF